MELLKEVSIFVGLGISSVVLSMIIASGISYLLEYYNLV